MTRIDSQQNAALLEQYAALDEESQVAVTMHQQAQKEQAASRKDRRAAQRDEIHQMRREARELRQAATRARITGVVGLLATGAGMAGQQGSKTAARVGQALGVVEKGCSLAEDKVGTQAKIAAIRVDQKEAQQAGERAADDVQTASKHAATAKDLLQRLSDARFRAVQSASRD